MSSVAGALVPSRAGRRAVLAASLLVLAIGVVALPRVRSDVRAIEFLDEAGPSRRALTILDRHLGGANLFKLDLETSRPHGIQEPAVLAFLEELRTFAEELPGVTSVYTYSQAYVLINRIMQNDAPGSNVLPDSPLVLGTLSAVLNTQTFAMQEAIHDSQRSSTSVYLRTRDMPAEDYLDLVQAVVEHARLHKPDGAELVVPGGLHEILAANRRIVSSQLRSLRWCLLAVAACLWLLWRSWRAAAAVVLASLPPLAAIVALMGFADLPLDAVTVMVAAVVMGVAVDDAIHLVTHLRHLRRAGHPPREALHLALSHKLPPMLCTTAVLVCTAGLLFLASFPPVAHFGWLTAVALIVALGSALTLLPILVLALEAAPAREDRS